MGLLKAGIGAVGGVLADAWREYFYCDAMPSDILMVKGSRREGKRSSNKGDSNIITDGSVVAINEGQCMMIVEQGAVVDFCAEPGEFVYDTSSEPSLFGGDLGEGLKKTFQTVGRRFAFGGDTGKDQRVYFFNTKEILGNKYGTATPVPFRVVDKNVGLDIDISVRCNGEYSYKMVDPLLFYKNVCGNVTDFFTRGEIDSQLKAELMTALQPTFARISQMGIRYSELPGHTMEIAEVLNQVLSQKWGETRGIAVASFAINSVNASPEDERMLKELQRNAAYRDPRMAAATLVGAQAQAMQDAAKNQSGSMVGFAGMHMAQTAGGIDAQGLFQMEDTRQQEQAKEDTWTCSCGTQNRGNFCANCGSPKAQQKAWICSCGTRNEGNFCINCGKKRPVALTCAHCGWKVPEGGEKPRFCPQCGRPFE